MTNHLTKYVGLGQEMKQLQIESQYIHKAADRQVLSDINLHERHA